MDTVRAILLAVEERLPAPILENFQLEGYDPEVTDYHILKLQEAGYLKATFEYADPPSATVTALTYEGHQFLDTIRNNTVWQQLKKKAASEGGSIPLEVLKPLAVKYLKELVGLRGD